jgi:hypothetical protein
MEGAFEGPLFVVGASRSGTKLVRAMLGSLPGVGFPRREARAVLRSLTQLDGESTTRARRRLRSHPYFVALGGAAELHWLDGDPTAASRFERFCRSEGAVEFGGVWGDKSPAYLRCLPTLAALWPKARFVHVMRDPREVCASSRRAWGRSLSRTAQMWVDDVSRARAWAASHPGWLELRYEDLVASPRLIAEALAAHVEQTFHPDMLAANSAEDRGRAVGRTGVVNLGPAAPCDLTSVERARVEAICGPLMVELGYLDSAPPAVRRLSDLEMTGLRILDGVRRLRRSRRDQGLLATLRTQRPS